MRQFPNLFLIITISCILFFSCNEKEKLYSPSEANKYVDSIFTIKHRKIKIEAEMNYELRIKTELKAKEEQIRKGRITYNKTIHQVNSKLQTKKNLEKTK